MNTWVVAFLNISDGEIRQTVVSADSKMEAYRQVIDREFGRDYWVDYVEDSATTSGIEEHIFNCDCYISALKIST